MMSSLVNSAGIFFISSYTTIESHFNGICYLEKDIIIGEKAFLSYIKINKFSDISEGRFTAIYPESDSTWVVTNDDSGQGILYYYFKDNIWAISNSFLYLTEKLYEANIKLNSNFDVFLGFNAFHSTTEQPVSNSTMIKEIKILPLHQFIKIIDNKLMFFSKSLPLCHSYQDDIVQYSSIFSGRIRSLHQKFPDDFHLDISGGHDSRTVFSLVLSSGINLDQVNFRSNRNLKDDYIVACELSEKYKFKIKNKGLIDKEFCSLDDQFTLWKYGNLGIYFPTYLDINSPTITKNIQLHGAGGGALKGVVNDTTPQILAMRLASRIKSYYSKSIIDSFKNEVIQGACDAGIKFDDSLRNIYYSNYRSRFHFGRAQYRNLYSTLITPLTSTWLYFINERGQLETKNHNIYVDLMLIGDKELPQINFDSNRKNFSKEQIESSVFYKETPLKNDLDFKVHFEEDRISNVLINDVKSNVYEYMCDVVEDVLRNNSNPFVDKKIVHNAILEIRLKRNVTKNFKILSFNLSILEISKFCADLS